MRLSTACAGNLLRTVAARVKMRCMDDPSRWTRLLALARDNNDVITARMISGCGMPLSTFYDYADRHGATQRHRGVWTTPHAAWTALTRASAALAAVGQPAMLTGEAGLQQLEVLKRHSGPVTVLLPPHRSSSGHREVRVLRTREFDRISPSIVNGLRVAPVEQCLKDSARGSSVDQLARRMAAACRLRLTDLDLLDAYGPKTTFPGKRAWDAARLALRGEMAHSNPEQAARDALRPHALGFEPAPYTVYRDGIPIAEIDIARPDILFGVEVDGPHHLLEEQRRRDEARDQNLRDDGWRIDRFWWDDVLADPARFARRVARAVEKLMRASASTLQSNR